MNTKMISEHKKVGTEQDQLMNGTMLPLMDTFYTIQGEGFHQGKASYFIRLAGCDIGCHWCDIKDSWDAAQYPLTAVDAMADSAAANPMKIAVITGGEPFMYDLSRLSKALKERKILTHIETSGAYPITGNWDWVCLSPKKFRAPLEENLSLAHELKVIIYNKSDFEWAEEYAGKVNKSCKLYLQPEWNKAYMMMPLIVDYIKEHPQWEVSLQIHKYMNIP